MRTVVWVSAGAASAVAAKLVLAQVPCSDVVLAYTDPGSEPADNHRFLDDLEKWYGHEILRLRSTRFRDVDDVIETERYINGIHGAPCTRALKRQVRFSFQRPDDRQVFGYTADKREISRARAAEANDPGVNWWWPLIEAQLTKSDTLAMVERAGLRLPDSYKHFDHANCRGCVKANNVTYWNITRQVDPEIFWRRARQERDIGHSIVSIRVTPGSDEKTPVWLDELDPALGKGAKMPDIECSIMCVIAEASYD